MKTVKIFDTTLRDGEQSPGISLDPQKKLTIAKQLARLGVDVIEVGFPVTSPGDFKAVKNIAESIKGVKIAALSRVVEEDIKVAWDAIKNAEHPVIHTFVSTSKIHMEKKLKKTPEEVLRMTKAGVSFAKSLCSEVEFSAEDATRSDPEFLVEIFKIAIDCGATVINVPDTVGYAMPEEFKNLLSYLCQEIDFGEVTLSVHCHNDLGLAVSNSLAVVSMPIPNVQIECAVNGLGERAGNAALEEVVMVLDTRDLGRKADITTAEIIRTSNLVSRLTGFAVPKNKAIVGANAFVHSSGIHSDGMMKDHQTYEIMTPEKVGLITGSKLVLGKTSGRNLIRQKLSELGYDELTDKEFTKIFEEFKALADIKQVTEDDLDAIALEVTSFLDEGFRLDEENSGGFWGNEGFAALVITKNGNREIINAIARGDGAIDAAVNAINDSLGISAKVKDYNTHQIGEGSDAQAEAMITVEISGKEMSGRGISTDTVKASVKAYLNAINRLLLSK